MQLVNGESNTRQMYVSATLNAKSSTSGNGIPDGATAGGLRVNLGDTQDIEFFPYIAGSPSNPQFGWFVSWNDNGTYRATHTAPTNGSTSISITATGVADLYAGMENPTGASAHTWGVKPETMRDLKATYAKKVSRYYFTLTIGGNTYNFSCVPNSARGDLAGVLEDISITTTVKSPYTIPGGVFQTDGNSQPLWPVNPSRYACEYSGDIDAVYVTGTYSRSPDDVCKESREYSATRTVHSGDPGYNLYRPSGSDVSFKAHATMGNGHFTVSGGVEGGVPGGNSRPVAEAANVYIHDWCGTYNVYYETSGITNMDGVDRSANVTCNTIERHPRLVETLATPSDFDPDISYNYNGDTADFKTRSYVYTLEDGSPVPYLVLGGEGLDLQYRGKCHFEVLFPSWPENSYVNIPHTFEDYIDLNDPEFPLKHGGLTVRGVEPTWNRSAMDWIEGSMKEPAHPPWKPLPAQRQAYDESGNGQDQYVTDTNSPDYGKPLYAYGQAMNGEPWYDNQPLINGTHSLSVIDALKITMTPVVTGTNLLPNPPLVFSNSSYTWHATGCTVNTASFVPTGSATCLNIQTSNGGSGMITATGPGTGNFFSTGTRLTGARYLNIPWYTDKAASAILHLGGHSWTLTAASSGSHETRIDLCNPDSSEGGAGSHHSVSTTDVNYETPHPCYGTHSVSVTGANLPEDTLRVRFHFTRIDSNAYPDFWNLSVYSDGNLLKSQDVMFIGYDWWTDWIDCQDQLPTSIAFTDYMGGDAWGFQCDMVQYRATTVSDAQQSIIPYEMPFDKSATGGARQPDSYYTWTFPKGWGVGRLDKLEIELPTANCHYQFLHGQFYRVPEAQGGFVKLFVLPQYGPWNDSRNMSDFAWYDSGFIAHSEGGQEVKNAVSVVPKAFLVVDGAVVLEIPQEVVIEHESDGEGVGDKFPWYEHVLRRLVEYNANTHNYDAQLIGYPLDNYTSPTRYDINGVATVQTNPGSGDFWMDNCLIAHLGGGTYTPNASGEISVPMHIRPWLWYVYPGTGWLPGGVYIKFRGQAHGIAIDPNQEGAVTISNPLGSPGAQEITQAYVSDIGWYQSKALNTKGPFAAETVSLPETRVNARTRLYSRLVCYMPELALRYCADDGSLKCNADGSLALDCLGC